MVLDQLWRSKALPNVLTTAWRVLLDRLPTRVNLMRRGVVVSTNICVLYQETEESTQHLFIECAFAQRVWCFCFRWIGILFVEHKALDFHFEHFHLSFLTVKQNQVWKGFVR